MAALRDLADLTMTEIELRAQLEELKALQVERGKQRVLLTSILDSIEDSIVVTGSDGKVLLTNPGGAPTSPTRNTAKRRNSRQIRHLFGRRQNAFGADQNAVDTRLGRRDRPRSAAGVEAAPASTTRTTA